MDRDRPFHDGAGYTGNCRYRRATLRSAAASLTATAGGPHLDNRVEGENV